MKSSLVDPQLRHVSYKFTWNSANGPTEEDAEEVPNPLEAELNIWFCFKLSSNHINHHIYI